MIKSSQEQVKMFSAIITKIWKVIVKEPNQNEQLMQKILQISEKTKEQKPIEINEAKQNNYESTLKIAFQEDQNKIQINQNQQDIKVIMKKK